MAGMLVESSNTEVCSVLYDSGSVPDYSSLSPRGTSPEASTNGRLTANKVDQPHRGIKRGVPRGGRQARFIRGRVIYFITQSWIVAQLTLLVAISV